MSRAVTFAAVVIIGCGALLVACWSPVSGPGSTVPGSCQLTAPIVPVVKTDILFLIDNSGSMADKQQEIAVELPAFVQLLQQGAGAAHDFQVGVVTSSVYQNARYGNQLIYSTYPSESGRLQAAPIVGLDGGWLPGTEKFLSSSDPQLISKFTRLVHQGTGGSGQETPFEALRLALTPPLLTTPVASGGNKEFFRDGARLLIIVVSDDDDCSETTRPPQVWVTNATNVDDCHDQQQFLTSVSDYFNVIHGVADSDGVRKDVIYAALAPVSEIDKSSVAVLDSLPDGGQVLHAQNCPNAEGTGYRHRDMASMFDSSLNDLSSVCFSTYHQWLLNIAQIANASQTLEVSGVPDPALLKVELTRGDGHVDSCTVTNGGISYDAPANGRAGRIHFEAGCARQPTDQNVQVKLLCLG